MIYTTNWIERLQKDFREGDEDARGDAKRRVCTAAYGQDRHGQKVIPEAGAENRSLTRPYSLTDENGGSKAATAALLPNKIDIFAKSKESENSERTH